MQQILAQLDPDDLKTIGYPVETLWTPLEAIQCRPIKHPRKKWTWYRLQRKLIMALRAKAQKGGLLRKILRKIQLACDVLLRES